MKKVSIVATTYNHEKYVHFFIQSILAQTYTDFELIIIDDHSTDNTVKKLREYRDARFTIISNPYNSGPAVTMNNGLVKAKGEYVVMINVDDILTDHHIEKGINFLDSNSEFGAICFPYFRIDINNNQITDSLSQKTVNFRNLDRVTYLKKMFLDGNVLPSPGEIIRRDLLQKIGLFNSALIQTVDYDFHVRTLLHTNIALSPEATVGYRIISDNSNLDNKKPASSYRHQNEMNFVLDNFLNIDSELYNNVFQDIEHSDTNLIPYKLSLMALASNDLTRRRWGYNTMLRFITNTQNLHLLHSKLNICYKDFSDMLKDSVDSSIEENMVLKDALDKANSKIREINDSKLFKLYDWFKKTIKIFF